MVVSKVTSALFGSWPRRILTVLVAIVVLIGGAVGLGVFGKPSVEEIDNSFAEVNESTTVIETDIVVENPNPIGTDFAGLSAEYEVEMNGITMATGKKNGINVAPGTSTVTVRTYMNNERIPAWWVSHIENGEKTSVVIDATVSASTFGVQRGFERTRTIRTDVLSGFESSKTREVESDQLPAGVGNPIMYVNSTNAAWGEVTQDETPIDMEFVVYNPKRLDMVVTQISYRITMNDVTVGEGETAQPYRLPAEEQTTIAATTIIDNSKLDEWWVSHLENGQVTDLRINFSATVEVAGQTFQVPLEQLTYEKRIETDIFGSKSSDEMLADGPRSSPAGKRTTTDLTVGQAG